MVKTEFMKLYEELGTINESIADIDFKALATAETEAVRLRKEIIDLDRDYRKKIADAKGSDEEYKKTSDELWELNRQLDKLKQTYERREWFRSGPDEYDHEDWVDEEAYAKVKDRDAELRSAIEKLEANINTIEARLKQQFEVDAAILKDKQAEHQKHSSISSEYRDKLKQAFDEVKPELQAVADYLNELEGKKVWEVSTSRLTYDKASNRILASLYTRITSNQDFKVDDFDYDGSGELYDSAAEDAAESAVEFEGYFPEQIIDSFELEASLDEGWFKIPNSDWELSVVEDVEAIETPTFKVTKEYPATYWEPADWDYEEDGELVVECRLTLGKKVN